jgi:type IV secretory pathway VirB2 component (pilin)
MGMTLHTLLPMVGPDFGAVGGSSELRAIVGALLTYGLVVAVLMVIVCAATWAIGSAQGSWQTASKAKTGLFVALGGAALTGGALAWANWLLGVGATL